VASGRRRLENKFSGDGGGKAGRQGEYGSHRYSGQDSRGHGQEDRKERKNRDDDGPRPKRERQEERPAPTAAAPSEVCFAFVKNILGVAGASPCREGDSCRFEHLTWPRKGISGATRTRLLDCLNKLKGPGAAEAVAAAKALPRA
jgi:hypothetical protein